MSVDTCVSFCLMYVVVVHVFELFVVLPLFCLLAGDRLAFVSKEAGGAPENVLEQISESPHTF
jgi:hypothetical protein